MKKQKRRGLRSFMAAALCFSLIVAQAAPMAYAAQPEIERQTLCEHHPVHDEECGYTEGSQGTPCTHEHIEECYALVTECVHEHTEDCYLAEDVLVNRVATQSEPNETEPTECTHECSEESGCITEKLDCQHEHDESCGYAPAVAGTACTYVCEICSSQNQPQSGSDQCICTEACTEDNINEECPVCGEDFTDCEGVLLGTPPDALAVAPEQVQEMIDDLPTVEELQVMSAEEQQEVYTQLQTAYDAYEALTDEQKAKITGAEIFDSLFDVFDELTVLAADDIGFTIGGSGESYTYEDGVLTVQDNADLTISTSEQTSHRIVVANGATATITLSGVNIATMDTNIPIDVPANSTLLLKLNDNTENTITAAGVRIGPASPGIHVPKDATLIIQGEGGITVNGGTSISGFAGAGIGGKVVMEQTGYCPGEPCGTVIILSTGTIEISGGQNVDTSSSGKDIGGGRGSPDGDDGQGIRPVPGQANTYEVWGELKLPEGVTIPEGAILTGDGSISPKLDQSAPGAPTLISKTSTSVTLNAIAANSNGVPAEYGISKDRGKTWAWQSGPEFSGLSSNTTYQFAARYGETDKYKTSDYSDILTVVTDLEADVITITLPTFAPVRTGYTQPDPKPIEICNSSDDDATIVSVSCTGVVFKIQPEPTQDLLKIPAHGKNTHYALRPEPGMVAGEYTSPITVTCRDIHNNTHTVTATARFTVLPQPTSGGNDSGSSSDSFGTWSVPTGTWVQDSVGWWYRNTDGTYPVSCWQKLAYGKTVEWYHFDERGYMQTGWFTDAAGQTYYLHDASDGRQGYMYTGWHQIDGKWYYFREVQDSTEGALYKNTRTPDGYMVDENGVWKP